MTKKILFLNLFFISIFSNAQTDSLGKTNPPNSSESYNTLIEQQPEFPGGEQAMSTFINQNLVYPKKALENSIEGTVIIRFTVEVTGELSNIIVLLNKEKLGYGLEEAAIDMIKKMPLWNPGKQNGNVVSLTYNLPVQFSLLIPLSMETKADKNKLQEQPDKIPNNVFLISTVKPQFPGGRDAMIRFISNELNYPKQAIENKIEGRVTLKFIVDSLGKICCVGVIGEQIGYGLEEEAIRIVRAMPLWIPASQDNLPVAVYYRMPITFRYYEE
ncbi:MAG: energy transducer TonB [Bacteroidia bacterium]